MSINARFSFMDAIICYPTVRANVPDSIGCQFHDVVFVQRWDYAKAISIIIFSISHH